MNKRPKITPREKDRIAVLLVAKTSMRSIARELTDKIIEFMDK